MRFAGWYLKIAGGGAAIGASMELFMIHTGFCVFIGPLEVKDPKFLLKKSSINEKVTVLESEKRAWESSPEAQAMREALNPWHRRDEQEKT